MKFRRKPSPSPHGDPDELQKAIRTALQRCPVQRILPILGWQQKPEPAAPSGILRLTMVLYGTRHVRVPQPKRNRIIALEPGDIMVIAPSAWSRPRVRAAHQCLNVDCFPGFTRFVFLSHGMDARDLGEGVFHTNGPMGPVPRNLLQALASVCEATATEQAEDRIRPILLNFMDEALRECQSGEQAPVGLTDWQRAVEMMHDHLDVDLTRDLVAASINVHPNHLSRICKRFTGSTLATYMTNIRMTRACEFLRDHRLSIAEVAKASGYRDETHFRKRFKQVLGLTPSQWRRRQR